MKIVALAIATVGIELCFVADLVVQLCVGVFELLSQVAQEQFYNLRLWATKSTKNS